MEGVDKHTPPTQKPENADESGVTLSETSWIDRLTAEELAGLDDFDRRVLLDELAFRQRRVEQVEKEKSVALAGAMLVANTTQTGIAAAYADGVADGTVRGATRASGGSPAPTASLDVAFRAVVRTVVRDELASGPAKHVPEEAGETGDTRRLLTISEVAGLAGVDPQTVRGWLKSGDLRFVPLGKNGKTIRIRVSDYDDYLAKKSASTAKKVDLDDLATDILRKRRRRAGAK